MADVPAKRGVQFDLYFPIYDADGDLVVSATGLDSLISKDGNPFAACVNEAVQITSLSGIYKLTLVGGVGNEMDADVVCVITKTSSPGAKTAVNVVYTATRQLIDLAWPTVSGRSIDVTATGEVGVDLDNIGGTLGAAEIATDALDDSKLAADLDTYQAKVSIIDDDAGGNDRYGIAFYKNAQPIASGLTGTPDIWVFTLASTPIDLVGTGGTPQLLTAVTGVTGVYFHDETVNRIASGTAYMARIRATIDGLMRTWFQSVGRDSA